MPLRAAGLVVRHHPSHPPVLAGVDLEIGAGELVAIIGPNGSGKSTLARALAGLVPLEAGIVDSGVAGARPPRVGLVLQDPAAQLLAATVADEIALGPQSAGRTARAVAGIVDRAVRINDLDSRWQSDPGRLSGGQQQRVAVAAIEACDVDVIVLDEPTALLDPAASSRFADGVRAIAGDRGVAWITQDPDEVERCDRVVVLDAGVVVWSGPVAEYVADPALAATWKLDLPATARVVHSLMQSGVWPRGVPVPGSCRELAAVLTQPGSANG